MRKVECREVSDEFWEKAEPLIPRPQRDLGKAYKRKAGAGRKPLPARRVFSGIVCVLRTGIQWNALPKERFGSPKAVHRYFREWSERGFFLELWKAGLAEYDEMEGIAWEWQSVDGSTMKAPLAQEAVGPNPTGRGKKGSKRHLQVDARGVPLALVVTGANRHDVAQLGPVLDARIAGPEPGTAQNLCADAGYAGKPAERIILEHGFVPHVRSRKDGMVSKTACPGHKPRRWVVEVSHSWFTRFRKLLVRFEKKAASSLALHQLADAIIVFRKVAFLYGPYKKSGI